MEQMCFSILNISIYIAASVLWLQGVDTLESDQTCVNKIYKKKIKSAQMEQNCRSRHKKQ